MKKFFIGLLKAVGILLLILVVALGGFLWLGNYHPKPVESAAVSCPESAPLLEAGQDVKALTWNVQTLSSKNYVFWSDLPNNDGPDEKPSKEDITATFEETVRVIRDENPDIIFIQEIDSGAERTYYEDQMARLTEMLPEYPCYSSVFDWKSAYVPHPRIHGSVGWKVAILSKYKISEAERIQLSTANKSFLENQFKIKPAILKAMMPTSDGGQFAALTLHLDLYVPGTDAKEIQLAEIDKVLSELDAAGIPWLLGGDFNLLPFDDAAYARLAPEQQKYYNPKSELKILTDTYQVAPTVEEMTGADFAKWFTRWPNDPSISGPDRALDYYFLSDMLGIGEYYVRSEDTLYISDHLPVVVEFQIP
ncbi:MAG: endonuclease/exonuclease/phosphatase family protein [Anaerolineales bacterium]|nr:endonuclease/exonuclease/phosphatase family protein [Anaerolineales bacterium]MCZ2121424.1 endonuclease/exonuclease/phosphatase family protein [Anaerolineales bacterium]